MAATDFFESIRQAAEQFIQSDEPTCVISHNDTDGVCSAAIIGTALRRAEIPYQLFFLTRQEKDPLARPLKMDYNRYLFLDFGSQEIDSWPKKCFILDHHQAAQRERENVIDVNPVYFGLDGGQDLCAATVCYLFAHALNKQNRDLILLALIGATGDSQKRDGQFSGINQQLLEEAKERGLVYSKKGLAFYGWSCRPIHKALEYSTSPFIPGITGSESAAIKFLKEIGIEPQFPDGKWKTLDDLTDEEKAKLASAIIAARHNAFEKPEKIFEEKLFCKNPIVPELAEFEVFSAWLNSCAKLGRCDLAFGLLMGDKKCYYRGQEVVANYRKDLIKGLNEFYNNLENPKIVIKTQNAIYFKTSVKAELISTISTILSHDLAEENKLLFVIAKHNDMVKISARLVHPKNGFPLNEIIRDAAKATGGQGGGHKVAAGALIPPKIDEFINLTEQSIAKYIKRRS